MPYVKRCKENLVIHGNFDNNMECCIAKDIRLLNMIPLNGLNKNGLKLGSRFCEEHLQDHQIDKVGTYKVKGEISVECNRIS